MERMLAVMADHPAAAVAGFVAMACFATWPLFRARWTMLMAYIGNNLGFAVHYALLGEWTAVAMNGLMGVQTVVAIMLVRQPRLRWAYYALMPVLALASVLTWQGLPSFFSTAAVTLSTIGRIQTNERALRVLLLASTPLWAVHDLIVGSLPGLTADVLSMAIGATMLLLRSPAVGTALDRPAASRPATNRMSGPEEPLPCRPASLPWRGPPSRQPRTGTP
jgi:Bacterial inner membrane protein